MVVTVNGRALDITLENERTLGDVLAGVEKWLQNEGFSLSALEIDGERIGLDDLETVCARDIGGIARIDIGASTWAELMREALERSEAALAEATDPSAAAGAAGRWARSAAASFLAVRDGELHGLVARALQGTPDELEKTAAAVRERIGEIDDPRAALNAFRSSLEPIATRLEALPLDLQTRKDANAAETVADFASLITKLFRLLPLLRSVGISLDDALVEGTAFRPYLEEFGAALKELGAAYEGGDAVLVGDLAEYELAPRLRSLDAALARVLAPVA